MKLFIAKFLMLLGVLGCAVIFLLAGLMDDSRGKDDGLKSLLVIGILVSGILPMQLYFLGKKLKRAVESMTISNNKVHVLYLRNFRSDKDASRGKSNWQMRLNFFGGYANFNTEEEQIFKALSEFGQLICIGKPGEFLPRLGALRVYSDNEHWQQKVKTMIDESVLIAIRASNSEGLLWELNRILELKSIDKIIILVPESQSEFNSFNQKYFDITGNRLPVINFTTPCVFTFRGIIWFENGEAVYSEPYGDNYQISKRFNFLKLLDKAYINVVRNSVAAEMRIMLKELFNTIKNDTVFERIAPVHLRIKATLIDLSLLITIIFIFFWTMPSHFTIFGKNYLASDSWVFIPMVYFIAFESIKPFATPGKMLMNIHVQDEEYIDPVVFQIALRMFLKFMSFFLLFGFYYLFKKKAFIHDKYSKTNVYVNDKTKRFHAV